MDPAETPAAAPLPQAKVPPASRPGPVRTWPHTVQISLGVLVGSLIVGLVAHSFLHGNIQRPLRHSGELPLTRLDLNHATRAELQLLPGVGEQLAQRIEAYRILNGPYQSIDELRKVPGVGALTVERLRPMLVVSGRSVAPTSGQEAVVPPQTITKAALSPRTVKKEVPLAEPINLNTASAADLETLPGIGIKLAQRIVEARDQRRFETVDELRRVPGIGPKTLEKVRPYVVVGTGDVASR